MAILTLAEVREHIETGMSDNALQRLMDVAEEDIIRTVGNHQGTVTKVLRGGGRTLTVPKNLVLFTVTEIYRTQDIKITSTQYKKIAEYAYVKTSGYRWADYVRVVYTPPVATQARRMAFLDLIDAFRISRELSVERVGDIGTTYLDPDKQRFNILTRLKRQVDGMDW